jgi:hypothetical protein
MAGRNHYTISVQSKGKRRSRALALEMIQYSHRHQKEASAVEAAKKLSERDDVESVTVFYVYETYRGTFRNGVLSQPGALH